jgi:ribosome-associated toxin RatA of RatAB toxin-antitoxin module
MAGALLFAGMTMVPFAEAGDAAPPHGQPEIKVLSVKGSETPKIVVRAVLNQPPKKVWQIVSDCAQYKQHMPHVAASKQLKKEGNKVTCQVTIAMPFPFSNLTAVTEAVHEETDKGFSRKWKLVRGDYNLNSGSWEVAPLDAAGTKSLVTYTMHADPKTAVPDWIREAAQKKALPEMMARVETEAGKL